MSLFNFLLKLEVRSLWLLMEGNDIGQFDIGFLFELEVYDFDGRQWYWSVL